MESIKETRKIITRANLCPETYQWFESHKVKGEKCNVTTKALEFYHEYCNYRKGFLFRILEVNYDLGRYLLRIIGRRVEEGPQ